METPNNNQEFNPLYWMNDPNEVAKRWQDGGNQYAELYPESAHLLQNDLEYWLLNDPLLFIGHIKRMLEVFPGAIDYAQEGPHSAQLRKLEDLKTVLTDTLLPKVPVHPSIIKYINENERELNDYLHSVLTIKQRITDSESFHKEGEQQNSKEIARKGNANCGIEKVLPIKLSLRQIAYYYHYTNKIINARNKNEIAAEYGYSGGSSGNKLLTDHYNNLTTCEQRLSGRDAIKDIETVMLYLRQEQPDSEAYKQANNELGLIEKRKR